MKDCFQLWCVPVLLVAQTLTRVQIYSQTASGFPLQRVVLLWQRAATHFVLAKAAFGINVN